MPEQESQSFTITVNRTFEVDYTQEQIDQLMRRTGEDSATNAIATARGENEAQAVRPVEKLIGINVSVDGPDDE